MTNSRDLANLGGGFIQAGGGVQRTVESKLKDVVSVNDFGPFGDGIENDAAAIQKAIDSVSGRKGETVVIDGNIRISQLPTSSEYSVTDFKDLTWPLNNNVQYLADTRGLHWFMNHVSTAYQVAPVITTPWAPSTFYEIGTKRVNGGNAYMVTATGTSDSSGGPSGTGQSIIDGTVTWRYITNGYYGGVPDNTFVVEAPYHPSLILDVKTPVSFDGVLQDAHQIAADLVAAGISDTSKQTSIGFHLDGAARWQIACDGYTNDLSFNRWRLSDGASQYYRMHFSDPSGDCGIHRRNPEYPLDVGNRIRVMQDTSYTSDLPYDNPLRFPGGPRFILQHKTNTYDRTASIRLDDNGLNLALKAHNGNDSDSILTLTAGYGNGTEYGVQMFGFYKTFCPITDSNINLGQAANKWNNIYAANGTIITSDEREKQDIEHLSEAERQVAASIKGLIKKFRYKSAVQEKGDGARLHVGVIAQEVVDAFRANGLDPFRYGIVCYDEWEEQVIEHTAEIERRLTDKLDENGEAVYEEVLIKEAHTEVVPAGNRYGIRYEELLAFIIAAL